MDCNQSTPRDDDADDVLDDDGVLDVDDKMRVVREVRFERASRRLKKARERTNEGDACIRSGAERCIHRSFVRDEWTNERTNERDGIVRIEAMVTRARVVGRSNARATRASIDRSRARRPAWPNSIDSDSD